MRKLIFVILALVSISAAAQGNLNDNLTFIYINHTTDTPVQMLCERLDNEFKSAKRFNKPLIIYLANGKNSYIAKVGVDKADTDAYDNIIRALQERRFHNVAPKTDVLNIIDIFNHNDFLTEEGSLKYKSMTWEFYINQEFWDANYNEQIIARLYYALDLANFRDDFLHLMIYYSGEEEFVYDIEAPFGEKNLCKNLTKLEILNY